MSTSINCKEQELWVSNQRFASLLEFALRIGDLVANSAQEQSWVERLRQFDGQRWPGANFDLDERFPDLEEKKFWTRVFHDVARAIFLRQIGNHEITFWQSSAIGDAYFVARMLTQAVCQIEIGWHPETDNTAEADAFHANQNRDSE